MSRWKHSRCCDDRSIGQDSIQQHPHLLYSDHFHDSGQSLSGSMLDAILFCIKPAPAVPQGCCDQFRGRLNSASRFPGRFALHRTFARPTCTLPLRSRLVGNRRAGVIGPSRFLERLDLVPGRAASSASKRRRSIKAAAVRDAR